METDGAAYRGRITQDPAIMVGKPVIRGTRISVEKVIAQLAVDLDLGDLFATNPELSREDVQAALEYAHAVLLRDREGHESVESRNALSANV